LGAANRAIGIDALLLGGTELSLILDESSELVVPVLDTTRIHVAAIADWMLG
jgi:aspartate/glutamate racemase